MTSSPTPDPEARCAGPAIRRAHGAWRRRSTNSPSAWRSIRSRCASASIRAPCGARSGASARRGSAGRRGMRRAPIPARSSAAWAWRSRCGAPMCRPPRRSKCRIHRDGTVEALSGVQDIGSGIGVVIAQTIAEVLGLAPEAIIVRIGDTAYPPGPPSYGSRTTASITPPARVAAWKLLQQLLSGGGARAQRARRRARRARRAHRTAETSRSAA